MIEYIYDNSFDGLLTALFYAYSSKTEVRITAASRYMPSLLTQPHHVTTEEDKALRLVRSIRHKLSPSLLKDVYYLYLSEAPLAENLILDYLKLCYTYGPSITLAKNNDTIIAVDTLVRKVSHESHRMNGFVRFKEITPGVFYSQIEPDHHMLPLLVTHFTTRFSDQHFIIHDIKRSMALVYNKKEAYLQVLTPEENLSLSTAPSSDPFEELFKAFYTSTTIPERMNPKLQKRLMPVRYWKHLVEV